MIEGRPCDPARGGDGTAAGNTPRAAAAPQVGSSSPAMQAAGVSHSRPPCGRVWVSSIRHWSTRPVSKHARYPLCTASRLRQRPLSSPCRGTRILSRDRDQDQGVGNPASSESVTSSPMAASYQRTPASRVYDTPGGEPSLPRRCILSAASVLSRSSQRGRPANLQP